MIHELILKNGNILIGDEIAFHGNLTSIVRKRNIKLKKRGRTICRKLMDVSLVFSSDVVQINFVGVKEKDLEALLESFSEQEPLEGEAPIPASVTPKEEFVLETPLSEVMYN